MILLLAWLVPALLSCKTAATFISPKDVTTKSLPPGIVVQDISWKGNAYRVVSVDTSITPLKMSSAISTNGRVHGFPTLKTMVEQNGRTLAVAVNAGMFHSNLDPVGLYIENSKTYSPINLKNGSGNFFLKPNGFFALTPQGPQVNVSEKWDPALNAEFATQSGPMLVIDGAIHPAFVKTSTNLNIRSGVGVTQNRFVHLVISRGKVRLYDIADFYKEGLGCTSALYLDGHISQTYVRDLAESFPAREFATFIFAE